MSRQSFLDLFLETSRLHDAVKAPPPLLLVACRGAPGGASESGRRAKDPLASCPCTGDTRAGGRRGRRRPADQTHPHRRHLGGQHRRPRRASTVHARSQALVPVPGISSASRRSPSSSRRRGSEFWRVKIAGCTSGAVRVVFVRSPAPDPRRPRRPRRSVPPRTCTPRCLCALSLSPNDLTPMSRPVRKCPTFLASFKDHALEVGHEARGASRSCRPGGRPWRGPLPLSSRVDGVGVQRIGRGEGAGAPHGHVYRDPAHTLFGTSPSIARGASRSCRPGGGRSGQEPFHMRVDSVAVKRIARGEGRAGRDDACEKRTPTHSFWDVTFDRMGGEPEPSGSSKRWKRYTDGF